LISKGCGLLDPADASDAVLLEDIDEALMVLGESVRAAIYLYLERYHSLKKDEIPQRLENFSKAMRKIFGSGGPVIEKLILKRLCQKLNVNYESVKDKEFQAAVEETMKSAD